MFLICLCTRRCFASVGNKTKGGLLSKYIFKYQSASSIGVDSLNEIFVFYI